MTENPLDISIGPHRILIGDVRERLRDLPDDSVHCVVTSPPYFGLRDYSTGRWEGGSPECDHKVRKDPRIESSTLGGGKSTTGHQQEGYRHQCARCGAVRVDRQIGLEPTLADYLATMVDVFREVRRVLRPDGTVWLNIGDSYHTDSPVRKSSAEAFSETWDPSQTASRGGLRKSAAKSGTFKNKDLMMVPARLAIALQDDGWWLRSDIIWAKKAPMPESVTDRPTSAHEHVFLLAKQSRYYYDADAVREEGEGYGRSERFRGSSYTNNNSFNNSAKDDISTGGGRALMDGSGRNQRNVWLLGPEPFPEAHFATYPTEVPRRAIKAGCPEGGTVLDPFLGSGTTMLVAEELNRVCVGIELNPEYAAMAARRIGPHRPRLALEVA